MTEPMRPTAPPNLPALVKAAFNKAKVNGDVSYYPTQAAVLTPGSIAFQLRYAPSLAHKPKAPKPANAPSKPFNPFENPSPSMLIAPLPPSHSLVLNKFAIVPEHFILITKAFKPQTHVLEQDDVEATFACIQAYRLAGQELFAFFNSGPHSGASQPHRHLQLLSVEKMREGLEDVDCGSQWNVLVDTLNGSSKPLPFKVLTANISSDMSAEERHSAYLELYRQAVKAVFPDREVDVEDEGEAQISYNFAMTSSTMALCPRTAEGTMLKSKSSEDIGQVSLNGTVLAGTALVKNQSEWDALREDPDKLLEVLKGIGLPP